MQKPLSIPSPFRRLWFTGVLTAAIVGAGCLDTGMPAEFTDAKTLAGQTVSAERLNNGAQDYTTFCVHCHGPLGDGQGHAAAAGLWPPPRNFQQAQFKFTMVEQGELPTDEELLRIVKHGLTGTPMRAWDISDERLLDVIQYIKTFAPDEWEDEDAEPGEVLEITPDPYGMANRDEAVALGKNVYHAYGCYNCHPTYVRPDDIGLATEAIIGTRVAPQLRANWHRTQLKESEYGAKVLPPDFTWHHLRTVDPRSDQQEQVRQMYRIVAAGINGAAMPAWQGIMPEEQIWALAYYLESLTQLRNTPEREQFWAGIGVDPTGDVPSYSPGAGAE